MPLSVDVTWGRQCFITMVTEEIKLNSRLNEEVKY